MVFEVNVAELFDLMKEKSNALKLPFRGIELRDNYTFHEIQFFAQMGMNGRDLIENIKDFFDEDILPEACFKLAKTAFERGFFRCF